jgi:tRNA pseudouridine13 synthase
MKPRAVLRRSPEDFVVDEIPAYEPSGQGEHLYVRIRKRDVTTLDAAVRICRKLHIDPRGAGFAGMKDRRAVTTQTISVPLPCARPLPDPSELETDGVCVLSVARHANKLKPGHLRGNRFAITLREIDRAQMPEIVAALNFAGVHGAPNAFGPQRFGARGDNVEHALAWLSGRAPAPRDRRRARLLFSALQAHLYNEVLRQRVENATWDRPLLGDLLKKHDTGGLYPCTDAQVDGERAGRREVSPTGPIFGASMRWPDGEPAELERSVLERAGGAAPFEEHRALGEGSRRSLRLLADDLRVVAPMQDPSALEVHFVLPKGGYATTLIACAVRFDQETTPDEDTAPE